MKRFLPCIIILSLCLLSCRRIPLYDPESDVYLKLDLQVETHVSMPRGLEESSYPELASKLRAGIPEMVRVCFYDTQTHSLVTDLFLPGEGGFVDIKPGVYDVILYSLGMDVTRVDATSKRGDAYAYTSYAGTRVKAPRSLKGTVDEDYNVIFEPDHVLVGVMESFVIPIHAPEDGVLVLHAPLLPFLETYSFSIGSITGVENIAKTDVYITSQAAYKYLWDGRYPSIPVAVHTTAAAIAEKGLIAGVYNTFGRFPDPSSSVYLIVRITTTSGALYQLSYDVTEQINNPDNTGHEISFDEDIEIPAGGSGGGFEPVVDDWDVEIIDIPLT